MGWGKVERRDWEEVVVWMYEEELYKWESDGRLCGRICLARRFA